MAGRAKKRKVRFLYSGIRVKDLGRSIKFYQTLGFKLLFRGKMAHGGEYAHLAIPGQTARIELNYYPKGNRFFTPYARGEFDHHGFYVDDADQWIRRLTRAGGRVAIPAWDEPHSRIGYVEDPDGFLVEVFSELKKPKKPRRRA